MNYVIELTSQAETDLERHIESGDPKVLRKINKLLNELREHPTWGTGKPERLKHYKIDTWSRRISSKHRLIYRLHNNKVIVLVLSFWGHYEDK